MREILFRGKRIDNGKWAYGDLLHSHDGKNGYFINIIETSLIKEVYESTIGQYSGYKDINENRIFEGDLLIKTGISMIPKRICKFYEGEFGERFCLDSDFENKDNSEIYDEYISTMKHSNKIFQVVGNIYDNDEFP